jgi:hypothetical protein
MSDNYDGFNVSEKLEPDEVICAGINAEEASQQAIKGEIDYNYWSSLDFNARADAFDDLVAIIGSYEYDTSLSLLENRSERYAEVRSFIDNFFYYHAKREGYPE